MENLKNVKNYNEFKDSLNEELLWNAIKNLFNTMFGKIDKSLSDAVANFTKKLDNSKTWQESAKYYEEVVNVQSGNIDETLKSVTGPLGVRKFLSDNISVTYIQLQELYNKYQSPDLSPKKVFENTTEKDIFNYDKSDELKKNLLVICNNKVIELNEKAGNPYDKTKLDEYLKANTEIDKIPDAQNYTPDTRGDVNQNPTDNSASDSFKYKGNGLILEAEDANQQQNVPIDKLKESAKQFVNEKLYQYSLKKIKEVKDIKSVGNVDPYDMIAKTSQATKLYGSLSKLLRNIVNLDKNQLIRLRDELSKIKGGKPDDYKNEMPF